MSKEIEERIEEKKDMPQDEGLELMPSTEEVTKMLEEEESVYNKDNKEDAASKGKYEEPEEIVYKDAVNENPSEKREKTEKKHSTDDEDYAMDRGWLPQDEFKGNPRKWVNARQFNDRMNMMEQIGSQKKQMEFMQQTNQTMLEMIQKIAQTDVKKREDKVLESKHQAILEGNVEDVEKYEKEYHQIKEEANSFKDLKPAIENDYNQPKELREFVVRNKEWYNNSTTENEEMRMYADNLDSKYLEQPYYAAMPLYKRLEEVEKSVKSAFPSRFQNPNRRRAPAVEGKSYGDSKKPGKVGYKDLPVTLRNVVDEFSKSGMDMSKDDYAQQLSDTGALEYE